MLLRGKEEQRYGWTLQRKVKWNLLQKKLRQRITAQWKREKLTRDELQQRRIAEDADIGCP